MSATYPGGPAFPADSVTTGDGGRRPQVYSGMTLRDYFAAKAMQAVIQTWAHVDVDSGPKSEDELLRVTAEDAYRFADAMLAERSKGEQAC